MHSRATDRRSASKCQGKWPDQTLDQAFGPPGVAAVVRAASLACQNAVKAQKFVRLLKSSEESRLKLVDDDLHGHKSVQLPTRFTVKRCPCAKSLDFFQCCLWGCQLE